MGELTGELIQMNCHMVTSRAAGTIIGCGIMLAIPFGAIAVGIGIAAHDDRSRVLGVTAGVLAALCIGCAAMAWHGYHMPKEKIIHACANGPVSLERVAAVYDIVDVDGKELTLRERTK